MKPNDLEDEASSSPAGTRMLHPDQLKVMRIRTGLATALLAAAAAALGLGLLGVGPVPPLAAPAAVLLLGGFAAIVLAPRRYRAWGYAEGEDELAIRRGLWVRRRTIVPFGRVQHIDVAQGPIERRFALATLILHTAGTRGAAVPLPGLKQDQAEAMRDRIRAKIRQDLV